MPKKAAIVYHADGDGVCSAMLIASNLGLGLKKDEVEFIAMTYGREIPHDKIGDAEQVYMVDYSLQPAEKMEDFASRYAGRLRWIDHHQTAVDMAQESENLQAIPGTRESNPNKAACMLVWEYFARSRGDDEPPRIVQVLSDYDVWRRQGTEYWEREVMPVQMGYRMRLENPKASYDTWLSLLEGRDTGVLYERLKIEGALIYKFDTDQKDANMRAKGYSGTFAGYKALFVNQRGDSQMFSRLLGDNPDKPDVFVAYEHTKGKYWTVSLYGGGSGLVDCEKLAKEMGAKGPFKSGGGHRNAAGFQTDWESFWGEVVVDDEPDAVFKKLAHLLK